MSRVITPLGVGALDGGTDATVGLVVGALTVGTLAGLGVGGFGVVDTASGIIGRSAFAEGACGAGLGAGGGCSFADSFDVRVGDGGTTASRFFGPWFSFLAVAVFEGFAAGSLRAGTSFGSTATLIDWGAERAAVSAGPVSAASEVAGIRVPARGTSATATVLDAAASSFLLRVGDNAERVIRRLGGARSDGSSELISATAGRSPGAQPLLVFPIGLSRPWDCCGAKTSSRLISTGSRPLPPITTVLSARVSCAGASLLQNRARPMLKKATVAHDQPVGWPCRPSRPISNSNGDKRFREDSSAPQ